MNSERQGIGLSCFPRMLFEHLGQIFIRVEYIRVKEVLVDAHIAESMSTGCSAGFAEEILAKEAKKIVGTGGVVKRNLMTHYFYYPND